MNTEDSAIVIRKEDDTTSMCEDKSCSSDNVPKENKNVVDLEKRGEANIKPEYLIHNHVRKVNFEYVSKIDQEALLQSSSEEKKPAKLKGRNKRRYQDIKTNDTVRLCSFVIREETCPYGSTCMYEHQIEKFISKRQPDIGEHCYLFDTFGRCLHGVTCRFGLSHLTADFKSIKNENLWAKYQQKTRVTNILLKDVQNLLRRRKYNFDQADKIVSSFSRLKCKPSTNDISKNLPEVNDKVAGVLNEISTSAELDLVVESSSVNDVNNQLSGTVTNEDTIRLTSREIKKIDFVGKSYLAPLTTVGNLPFRRVCKRLGADITCGEMAMASNLLQGQPSEWALLKRHESEDIFGVQICGAHGDQMTRCAQLLKENINVDFIDINVGCPIDLVYHKGAGCGLMNRTRKFKEIIYGMKSIVDVPLTVKLRTGVYEDKKTAHELLPKLREWGVDMACLHGRSREQRYTKAADWSYVDQCAKIAAPMPLFGCGDILSYEDVERHLTTTSAAGVLIARGALLKPWIFTELKEKRHWDISSSERFDILKEYVNYGLEHWGSDNQGVENTRRFLLELLSFLYRYIPVGVLERVPQKINERPPYYCGRDDLETLMASPSCADWVKISEMLLGKVPHGFTFLPKHKANSYS